MNRDWWQWGTGPRGPWAAFAFGPRAKFFEFGEVRLAILSLLTECPKHCYQLMKEMKERSGGIYRASAGSVYPTLQQLEEERLIESERQDGRRVYKLTTTGQAELDKDPESVRRIWARAERWEDWGRWMGPETIAFVSPVSTVLKSALQAAKWAAGNSDRERRLYQVIQRVCGEFDELSK